MTFVFFLCNLNSLKRRTVRTSFSFVLLAQAFGLHLYQEIGLGPWLKHWDGTIEMVCQHSPCHSAGSRQRAVPRDFPGTALGTAVLETAPRWQLGHHWFVLGGRKLRHKDMGTVMSLASGHIRIFEFFCLARESLAHARKLPALSCWRQISKRTGEKHRSGKTSWFYKT